MRMQLFTHCMKTLAAHRLPEINSALQTLSEILQQLTNQKSSIENDIHTTFDELQKTLNVRKSVLLMELEVNYGLKQKVRNKQGDPCRADDNKRKYC